MERRGRREAPAVVPHCGFDAPVAAARAEGVNRILALSAALDRTALVAFSRPIVDSGAKVRDRASRMEIADGSDPRSLELPRASTGC